VALSPFARIIRNVVELREFQAGEVLVAHTTTPDWEPVACSSD
jgi:pyruvate,water dikinase